LRSASAANTAASQQRTGGGISEPTSRLAATLPIPPTPPALSLSRNPRADQPRSH
jgi:hypothetical protein